MLKKLIFPLAVFLLLPLGCFAQERLSFKTTDGRVYSNVSVSGSDAAALTIVTDSGVERIQLSILPSELQKRFGYEPERAAAQNRATVLSEATFSQQAEATRSQAAVQVEAQKEEAEHLASAITIFGTVSSKVAGGLIINVHVPAKFESSGEDFDGTAILAGNPNEPELAEGDNIGSPSLGVLVYRDGTYEDGVSSYRRYHFIRFRKIGDPADPN